MLVDVMVDTVVLVTLEYNILSVGIDLPIEVEINTFVEDSEILEFSLTHSSLAAFLKPLWHGLRQLKSSPEFE